MKKNFLIALATIFLFFSNNLYSQDEEHGTEASHATHDNHLGLFFGAASNTDLGHTSFALGLDYEYRMPMWERVTGFGFFGEYAFAEHSETTFGALFVYRPSSRVKIYVGPGVSFGSVPEEDTTTTGINIYKEKKHEIPLSGETTKKYVKEANFIIRMGLGFDIPLGRISLTPSFSTDFVAGHVVLVYGLALGMGI